MKNLLSATLILLISSLATGQEVQRNFFIRGFKTAKPTCEAFKLNVPDMQDYGQVRAESKSACEESVEFKVALDQWEKVKNVEETEGRYFVNEEYLDCHTGVNKENSKRYKTYEECLASKELDSMKLKVAKEEIKKAKEEAAELKKRNALIEKTFKANPKLSKFKRSVELHRTEEGMPESLVKLSCGEPLREVESEEGSETTKQLISQMILGADKE